MPPPRDQVRAVAAVFAAEWRQLLGSSKTYVVLACMLLAISAGTFLIGGLYDSDFVSLDLVWAFLPAIGILLVPALGVRAFADEGGNRETELMLTLPISDGEFVVGTWLAGAAVLAIALVLAAPVAVTIAYLGSPDWGVVASGAVGALLMLLVFHAVTLFASAVSGQQTTAYVLSVMLLLFLTACGWSQVQQLPLPASLLDALRALGPKFNLDRLATGRIEVGAVTSLVLEIALALAGAAAALSLRRRAARSALPIARLIAKGAAGLASIMLMLGATARLPLQLDATADKLFTLSEPTLQIARSVPAGTEIELYWSEGEAAVPANIRDFAHLTQQVLSQLAAASGGRLSLRVRNTEPDSDAEWAAVAAGIRRVPLSAGGSFFLGTVVRNADRRKVTPYLDDAHARRFEYDMALALSRIGQTRVPKVAVMSALLAPSEIGAGPSRHAFLEALKAGYDVAVVPFFADDLPDDLDALLIIGEAPVKQTMLRAIDRHVMRGRGLVVCLDPKTRFNKTGKLTSRSASSDLGTVADLLGRYGIAFDAGVVGDSELALTIKTSTGLQLAYPFWMRLSGGQLASTSPVTASLHDVVVIESGSLGLSAGARALATTGKHAGSVDAGSLAGASPADAALLLKPDGRPRTLIAMAGSRLASPFPDAVDGHGSSAGRTAKPPDTPITPAKAAGATARTEQAAVFVTADVDWLLDQAAVTATADGGSQPTNDNLALLENMVEVAAGDRRLLGIRSRGSATRRFTRVEHLMRASELRYRDEASGAQSAIDKIEATVGQVLAATKARSIADLPADVRARISQLYAESIPARQRLRAMRRAMREDVERLGRILTSLNLASGPLLALTFWLVVRFRRRRRAHGATQVAAP